MTNYILGISSGFHDSSACLVSESGNILFASSEERFSRVKGDSSFPLQSINACLEICNSRSLRVSHIALHQNPFTLPFARPSLVLALFRKPAYLLKFLRSLDDFISSLLDLCSQLNIPRSNVFVSDHHYSHAYASILTCPQDSGIFLVLDAIGSNSSGCSGYFVDNNIASATSFPISSSLGLIYSCITVHCGFRVLTGEYKLMGLAPYGKPLYFDDLCSVFGNPRSSDISIADIDIFSDKLTSPLLSSKLGFPARAPDSLSIPICYANLAASIQFYLEEAVHFLVTSLHSQFPHSRNLVLGGGIALNCKLTYSLSQRFHNTFDNIWAFPASGDAGSSIGAALRLAKTKSSNFSSTRSPFNVYLGLSDNDPDAAIYNASLKPSSDSPLLKVSQLIISGSVGAIFESSAEFGPRALGHRSIIANPCDPQSIAYINKNIKAREDFRPLAPVSLSSIANEYFDLSPNCLPMYPYMMALAKSRSYIPPSPFNFSPNTVNPVGSCDSLFPSVVHLDGTARLQILSDDSDFFLASLLSYLYSHHELGVLVNTSFNVRGEPIVNSYSDAISCFLSTGLDFLYLDGRLILRDEQHPLSLMTSTRHFSPD